MKFLGRPTKYDESMLKTAQAYVQHCQDAKEMPFIEDLALQLCICDDTIVEWTKEYPEFSATVKQLKMLQKLYLKKGALEKRLHAPIAMFLLQANHGIGKDENGLSEPLVVTVRHI